MILLAGLIRTDIIGNERRTSTLPVADVIDAWLASEEGPCTRCNTRTASTDPTGTRNALTAARRKLTTR